MLFAQEHKIIDKVTSAVGSGIPNVTVLVKNKNTATQTDLYGNFSYTSKNWGCGDCKAIGFLDKSVAIGI